MWHARCFIWHWGVIKAWLLCFGGLHWPALHMPLLVVEPGTTLPAGGGNEVPGGLPTMGSRTFPFAIGMPEEEGRGGNSSNNGGSEGVASGEDRDGEENNEEVQYSPILLHIDFCCILFGMLDFKRQKCRSINNGPAHWEAKRFLVDVLIDLIRDYPMGQYLMQIDEGQVGVWRWLDGVLKRLEDGLVIAALTEEAVDSKESLYNSPNVIKRRSCRKKKARQKSAL